MQILLCTSSFPGAAVIRWLTGSQWSHTALVQDGWAIEAVWPKVRRVQVEQIIATHPKHLIIDLPCADEVVAFAAAESQIGKPSDWTALLGWLVGRVWQDMDSWFCSELVAWAFEQGGSPLFRDGVLSRVTPQNLGMIRNA